MAATGFVFSPFSRSAVLGKRSSRTSLFLSAPPKKLSRVVLQKVVRPGPKQDSLLFLSQLVEFLQDVFVLPSNLPMPYDKVHPTPMNKDSFEDGGSSSSSNNNNNKAVVSWDSPLSSSVHETRLDVEVVGLYGRNQPSESSIPGMAMVVVTKPNPTHASTPSIVAPMMKNLFQDAERRILKSLEIGLDDFMVGKVPFKSRDNRMADQQPPISWQESLEADMMMETGFTEVVDKAAVPPQSHVSVGKRDGQITNTAGAIDATIEQDDNTLIKAVSTRSGEEYAVEAARRASSVRDKKEAKKEEAKSSDPRGGDFAVEAAKRLARQQDYVGDFANEAAKKVAQQRQRQQQKGAESKSDPPISPNLGKESPDVDTRDAPADINEMKQNHPNNLFVISTPESYTKKKNEAEQKRANQGDDPTLTSKRKLAEDADGVSAEAISPVHDSTADSVVTEAEVMSIPAEAEVMSTSVGGKKSSSKRKAPQPILNAQVVEKDTPSETTKADTRQPFSTKSTKTAKLNIRKIDGSFDVPVDGTDDDLIKAAQATPPTPELQEELEIADETRKLMDEMQPEDMTPEDLLKSVLKFDEEKKKEEEEGSGFVSGALEKAKELLREQRRQMDLQFKEKEPAPDIRPDIAEPVDETAEMQRIFEAGERLAESLVSSAGSGTPELSEEASKMVDDLVAAERTVSSYARSIEDELTELEVSINKSPGEELDGPRKNPIFDIMSGPEVYNPNVDPETAVNWPGALPGTKQVRLPPELEEALKNAKFAAEVLQTVEEAKAAGEETATYRVGKQELSDAQVENLRMVVNEAVQLGLIEDPLTLLQERSRLQLVLDELWDMPEDRFREIVENYKDLLLSDNFVGLLKERMAQMAERDLEEMRQNIDKEDSPLQKQHERERELLGQLVVYAQLLLKETQALGAELEAQQVEVIRSICKVAMDPKHTTEEETAMALSDAVKDMRPLFDDIFVAYIKYAVAEEEGRLARAGLLDDPEHNEWLFVLKIVQQGVYKEIAKSINRYLEHLWYVFRMETAEERRGLLERLIDELPTMDVRPFVQVVDNIASSLGDAVKGDVDPTVLGGMSKKIMQLHRDTHDLLPVDRINMMARDADEWAAKQKERMLDQTRLAKQRLEAAREMEDVDYDGRLRMRGDVDRFE